MRNKNKIHHHCGIATDALSILLLIKESNILSTPIILRFLPLVQYFVQLHVFDDALGLQPKYILLPEKLLIRIHLSSIEYFQLDYLVALRYFIGNEIEKR